jgi:tetratricopeptide (TPR) repeat protein
MRTLAVAILIVASLGLSSAPAGAADIDLARSRYEEAAYEDALKILESVAASSARERVQLEQYRALCHIALGHTEDAERAVIALVDADPTYLPPPSIASPKVLSIVGEIRSRHIPMVARKLLDSGRAAFAEKNMALATKHFSLLLKLLDEPAMADRPEREDYRTLAQGFVTLASAPAPAPAATTASMPAPGATTAPPAAPTASPAAPTSSPSAPAGNGAGAAGSVANATPRSFTPAVPLDETLPRWAPPNQTIARNEYTGSLKLEIGADGRVKRATMVKPSHPLYDAALLGMAKTWRYKPATQDGANTESERIIAIRLRPIS